MKIIFKNNIKNMKGFFENCSNLYSINLSNYDISNVKEKSEMFNECYKI